VTKSFQLVISPFAPGVFVPVSVQDFEKCITHKYEPTVMSQLQRLSLKLQQDANPFFFNRFVRVLQKNMFKNLIRLASVRLHLTTVLHPKLFSSDDLRPDLRNKPTNAITESFKFTDHNNILRPDSCSQSQPMVQAWLRQTRSLFAQILKQLSEWQSLIPLFFGNLFSTSEVLNVKPSSQKEKYFSSTQLISQLMTRPVTYRHGLVKRIMPNFKENFFFNGTLSTSMESPGEIPQKKFFNRINSPFHILVALPTTNLRNYQPESTEDIEEQYSTRHMSAISHLTLQPFRPWPNRLINKDGLKSLRLSGQVAEERLESPPAFIDKQTMQFVDNTSRKNKAFSPQTPPKMKLAVSEKKAVPDLKDEFQNLEQRVKKIKSAESNTTHNNIDIHHISERVYDEIERKLRIERERRGL
jgi:hypothetical protein